MTASYLRLAGRIKDELSNLQRIALRTAEAWKRAQESSDDYYLDSVALNLHGFYEGIEQVFANIALAMDGRRPEGPNSHQLLLQQMAEEIPGARPAVISHNTKTALEPFLGFRHVARHVYSFQFDPSQLRQLVATVPVIFGKVEQELLAMVKFMEASDSSRGESE